MAKVEKVSFSLGVFLEILTNLDFSVQSQPDFEKGLKAPKIQGLCIKCPNLLKHPSTIVDIWTIFFRKNKS